MSDSRHPPLTEPAILPDAVIAIFAPLGRGVEPAVFTTVATAIFSTAPRHRSTSSGIAGHDCTLRWEQEYGSVMRIPSVFGHGAAKMCGLRMRRPFPCGRSRWKLTAVACRG